MFFGSEKRTKTAATLYTLVQSARRNCVDLWPCLTDVLGRIAAIAPSNTATLEALPPIPSTGLSSGKKNPAKPRLVADGDVPHVVPPRSRDFSDS